VINIYGIIYCCTNLINNKKYIGQTKQKLQLRINTHLSVARTINKTAICQALNKYGFDNFEWVVIDVAINQKELDYKETYWVKYYNTYSINGYNMTFGGQDEKLKYLNNKERKLYTTRNLKDILVFNLDGDYIETITSMVIFANEHNIGKYNISKVLHNKKNSIGGYIFIYKDEFSEEILNKKVNSTINYRYFYVFDKITLKYINKWKSQTECGKDLHIDRGNISKCLTKAINSTNGYLFYYANNCPNELLKGVV
jgi:group I intron endonuclease